jgi:hypothetical protein
MNASPIPSCEPPLPLEPPDRFATAREPDAPVLVRPVRPPESPLLVAFFAMLEVSSDCQLCNA